MGLIDLNMKVFQRKRGKNCNFSLTGFSLTTSYHGNFFHFRCHINQAHCSLFFKLLRINLEIIFLSAILMGWSNSSLSILFFLLLLISEIFWMYLLCLDSGMVTELDKLLSRRWFVSSAKAWCGGNEECFGLNVCTWLICCMWLTI